MCCLKLENKIKGSNLWINGLHIFYFKLNISFIAAYFYRDQLNPCIFTHFLIYKTSLVDIEISTTDRVNTEVAFHLLALL